MTITKSIKGEKGEEGTGVNIIGKLENKDQLPTTGKPGDAYVIDGLLYVWLEENNGWSDGVPLEENKVYQVRMVLTEELLIYI